MIAGVSTLLARGRRLLPADPWDAATLLLFAGLAVLAVATLGDYAISNDEEVQRRYGELILEYYRSGFRDQALFHLRDLYLYGGLFDTVAVLTERMLPGVEPYAIRHLLCAATGLGGIAATVATARLVSGPRAGLIAAMVLAACGPWYGAMFNHTKDIPFAAAMAGGLFFLLRAARQLPKPRRRDVILFGVLLGAALGIRVLALLLVGYAGLAVAMRTAIARNTTWQARLRFFSDLVVALVPAFVIAYVIMILAWPWAGLAPLNPIRGLIDFGNFHYEIRTILGGQVYEMATVPRWYVPAYLLIKLPLVMIVGMAAALFVLMAGWRGMPRDSRFCDIALITVAAVFPVLCEVIQRGPAFTGLRHFLFVVPALAALAGVGFDAMLTTLAAWRPVAARLAFATLGVVLLWNAVQLVRLHPHQYLFYNPLVGGLAGAAERYVTDYWVNIMPEAVDQLEAYVAQLDGRGGHPQRYTVAVCGERVPFEAEANSRLEWTPDWQRAEFFIAPTHMACDRALQGRVIANIDRLGARIGVVKDRRDILRNDIARRP
ncbi:MAG: ArnT family glycosyltransferase [Pseudolabrys sp.]